MRSCGEAESRRQLRVKIGNRLPQGAFDTPTYKKPVVEAVRPGSRLVLDHEAVAQTFVLPTEVPLVTSIRQPRLTARVFDESVRLNAAQLHAELHLTTEETDDYDSLVARSAPT